MGVPDRLTSLDASFLYLEESTTPMHVGSVMVFDPPEDGFDYDRLVQLVSTRIAFVPRYRQRIRQVPGRLHLCLEEGEWSQWLYEVLSPHVAEVVVVWAERRSPAKSDALDARELAVSTAPLISPPSGS